ncbi:MAG: signal peptidase [Planctomycetes bacterium]|nr:signal peptidase [Planctomycetota bacterium]
MRLMGEFDPGQATYFKGATVIVQTPRGQELGEILCESTDDALKWLVDSTIGTILREVTPQDTQRILKNKKLEAKALETCVNFSEKRGIQLAMVDVELLFGAERLIFYYLSESRIDFRDLVKDLAREFQTRIEMRQIGIRDEAKLLADFGDCGKPVCCNSHLIEMPPVSMKMARMQKASLDPSKISGRCGRLKCCLRFEQDVYDAHQKDLPEPGTLIMTEKGKGRVLAQEILSRRLLVEFEDGRRISVLHSEILFNHTN